MQKTVIMSQIIKMVTGEECTDVNIEYMSNIIIKAINNTKGMAFSFEEIIQAIENQIENISDESLFWMSSTPAEDECIYNLLYPKFRIIDKSLSLSRLACKIQSCIKLLSNSDFSDIPLLELMPKTS